MRLRADARPPALEEIEAVYRSRFPAFLRVAVAIVGDEELGEDAVHDGFVRAVRHRGSFRGTGSLEGWLWRTVVNAARRRRTWRQRESFAADEQEPEPAAKPNGDSAGRELRALIAMLPERQRVALFLRYYADLDYRAIAEALGVKPGTVAATLSAAHAAIRTSLEAETCRT
jgi:RNA polymerase sigma factor (sigma-70 family)